MSRLPEHQRRVVSDFSMRDLAQLVALGESTHLEFKRRVPRPARIAKEVIALANTHGGRLLLGVTDSGRLVGVRDAEEEQFALRRALDTLCEPPVRFSTELTAVEDGRFVIIVNVPQSTTKPHYLLPTAPGGDRVAYVRIRDMSVEASPEAVALMEAETTPNGVAFEFGEKEKLLMRYLDSYGHITVDQFASMADLSLQMASKTLILLTRASVLKFHRDERQDYFTMAM